MAVREVAWTTDGNGNSNVRAWDLETGGMIAAYPGGTSQNHTLSFIKGDYILSAQKDKTAFCLWSFRQFDQINKKFAAPDKIRAMAVSPGGEFCAGGVDTDIFLWQIQTGVLLTAFKSHCQPVSVVKFNATGDMIISASLDSTICVWSLDSCQANQGNQPEYMFRDHTQAITDMAVRDPLIASVSTSGLLTIHSLRTECLEYQKNFGKILDSVDISEDLSAVFVGFREGTIVRLSLSDETELEFIGHAAPVKCLSVSRHYLLSGSDDSTARIWDANHGHLLHTLRHDGGVTNAKIAVLHPNALTKDTDKTKDLIAIQNFDRALSLPDKIRQRHDFEVVQMPADRSIKPMVSDPENNEDSGTAELREVMAKVAMANTDIVNFVIENM